MEWAQRVLCQTMVTAMATATNEMERDSYVSITGFLRATDAAQAAVKCRPPFFAPFFCFAPR